MSPDLKKIYATHNRNANPTDGARISSPSQTRGRYSTANLSIRFCLDYLLFSSTKRPPADGRQRDLLTWRLNCRNQLVRQKRQQGLREINLVVEPHGGRARDSDGGAVSHCAQHRKIGRG